MMLTGLSSRHPRIVPQSWGCVQPETAESAVCLSSHTVLDDKSGISECCIAAHYRGPYSLVPRPRASEWQGH